MGGAGLKLQVGGWWVVPVEVAVEWNEWRRRKKEEKVFFFLLKGKNVKSVKQLKE